MSEELSRAGEPMFTLVRRGYDPVEVDGYVTQMHHQLRGLQKPDQAVTDALDRVGNEVSDILKKAHETAREIVESAEQTAAETKKQADEHAANTVAGSETRLREIDIDTDRVWAERARIIADVRELSRQLLSVADLADERFPDEPEADEAAAFEPVPDEFETAEFPSVTGARGDDNPEQAGDTDPDAAAVHMIEPQPEPESDSESEPDSAPETTEASTEEDG